jgi:predicted AAA+ superfamily ATPase
MVAYRPRLVDDLLEELMSDLPAILIVGPRGAGKTTTALLHATSLVRLDVPAQAGAFRADPDDYLNSLPPPVVIDEWQAVPESFAAIKRAVDADPAPGRFLLTGSAYGDVEGATAAGTGRIVRLPLAGMTEREISGETSARSFIDRLADGELEDATQPESQLSLRDYVELALRSGFPEALRIDSQLARDRWLEGYVAQITTRDVTGTVGARDPRLLQRFLDAYAVNSAGVVEAKTIYDAAGINKNTAASYEHVLESVFVVESLPAWTANRLKRLALSPKRYIVDPGLMAAILRLDQTAIMRDSSILGRLIDTFVMAQFRGEIAVSARRPKLYHLRQRDGGHGIEVKAAADVGSTGARHLAWLRDELGDRFLSGLVLHTGPRSFRLGERIRALPISALWRA